MPINREKGKYASNQGRVLENQVKSMLEQKGFKIVSFTEWKNKPDAYGKELLLTNVPFKNIYEHKGKSEFLLKSEHYNLTIRIECKWQQSSGSVDEKFPYLYLNCIEAMEEDQIIIIVDGKGARKGAVNWLKDVCNKKKYCDPTKNHKSITVYNLTEFICWVNEHFR
jgi:hypothetical protein